MDPITYLFILSLVISLMILVKSSFYTVDIIIKLSSLLRLPKYILGFLLLSFTTSIPELSVAITSALNKTPVISLGNILGSNIANISIILGLAVLIAGGIHIQREHKRSTMYTWLVSSIPLILMFDHVLSRIDGVILVIVFGVYISLLLKGRTDNDIIKRVGLKETLKNLLLLALLFAILLLSSNLVVRNANQLAQQFNVSSLIIGILIIGVGTSLPELISAIPAIKKNQPGISLGNILGSIVTNSTLILGITAIISPIYINFYSTYLISVYFAFFSFGILLLTMKSGNKITRSEGLIMVTAYILFMMIQLSAGI